VEPKQKNGNDSLLAAPKSNVRRGRVKFRKRVVLTYKSNR
jgi:hypothetical protein